MSTPIDPKQSNNSPTLPYRSQRSATFTSPSTHAKKTVQAAPSKQSLVNFKKSISTPPPVKTSMPPAVQQSIAPNQTKINALFQKTGNPSNETQSKKEQLEKSSSKSELDLSVNSNSYPRIKAQSMVESLNPTEKNSKSISKFARNNVVLLNTTPNLSFDKQVELLYGIQKKILEKKQNAQKGLNKIVHLAKTLMNRDTIPVAESIFTAREQQLFKEIELLTKTKRNDSLKKLPPEAAARFIIYMHEKCEMIKAPFHFAEYYPAFQGQLYKAIPIFQEYSSEFLEQCLLSIPVTAESLEDFSKFLGEDLYFAIHALKERKFDNAEASTIAQYCRNKEIKEKTLSEEVMAIGSHYFSTQPIAVLSALEKGDFWRQVPDVVSFGILFVRKMCGEETIEQEIVDQLKSKPGSMPDQLIIAFLRFKMKTARGSLFDDLKAFPEEIRNKFLSQVPSSPKEKSIKIFNT